MSIKINFLLLAVCINAVYSIRNRRKEWNYKDCVSKKWYPSFNGSCYDYDFEDGSSLKSDIKIKTDCEYCVYRGFKSFGEIKFDYGYPECIKKTSPYGKDFHRNCFNKLKHGYSQILCCCDVHLCNDLLHSLLIPLPPPKSEYEIDDINLVDESLESLLIHSLTVEELVEESPPKVALRRFTGKNHGYDYVRKCKMNKLRGRWNTSCYHFDFFLCLVKKTDIRIADGCTFCATRYRLGYNVKYLSDYEYGYPVCVMNNTYGHYEEYDTYCEDVGVLPEDVIRYTNKCCCSTLCNKGVLDDKNLPILTYCPETTPTTTPTTTTPTTTTTTTPTTTTTTTPTTTTTTTVTTTSTTTPTTTTTTTPTTTTTTTPTTTTTTTPSTTTTTTTTTTPTTTTTTETPTTTPTTTTPTTTTTTTPTTTTTATPTTATTTTPTTTTTTTPTTTTTTETSTTIITTTQTTDKVTVQPAGINCFGYDKDKSIVVLSGCKGCAVTTVYNIPERPSLLCMRTETDPFDISEEFCNEYFLDGKVLMYVYCCYEDLCNIIKSNNIIKFSVYMIIFMAIFAKIILD